MGSSGGGIGSVLGGAQAFLMGGGMPGAVLASSALGGLPGMSNEYNPQGAELMLPADPKQIQNANTGAFDAQRQQQDFVRALGPQGIANQQNAYQMAMQQANGQGPNPAMQALANATQANTANQAALMAGQRGASANPGLIARQAAMQGGANQQQMAGQAALMQAQQQLAGQQMAAQIANQQVQQLQQGTANNAQLAQGLQGNMLNAGAQWNNAQVGNVQGTNQIRAGIESANTAGNRQLLGGAMQGTASALMGPMMGGMSAGPSAMPVGGAGGGGQPMSMMNQGGMAGCYNEGGPVSALGQSFINMQQGGVVPGKAPVQGDSPKNDKVPAMLSPGEIVIPRTVLQGKNAPEKAAAFVRAIMAKKGMA